MKKQRFSLRKLAVGVVSIGLGTAVIPAVTQLGSVEIVKADTDQARQAAIQEVETKREEVVAAILKLKNNDLTEEQVRKLVVSENYYLGNLGGETLERKDKLLTLLASIQFKYDLIDEVLTKWNAFYVSKGIEHKLGFSDLERLKEVDLSPNSKVRYSYPVVSRFVEPTYSLSSSFRNLIFINSDRDENNMIRDQRSAFNDLRNLEKNYEDLKEAREKYNEVVTYFNAQPEEIRKEQFNNFADESFRSIWNDIQSTGAYLNREVVLRKLTLLENRIKGKIADEKAIAQAVKEVNDKKSAISAAIQKLENITIQGEASNLYVNENGYTSYDDFTIDGLSQAFHTFEELETTKQTKLRQWEHLLEQMNVINDILIKANQFEEKQGREKHSYTIYLIDGPAVSAPKTEHFPATIARPSREEFLESKEEVSSVDLPYKFYNTLDEIRYTGDNHVIEEKKNVALSLLSLAEKKYDAMTEAVSAYNNLIDKINTLPQEKRHQTWLDLIYQKDPYLYVLDELRFGDGETEEETESRKENLLAIFKKFDQETFAATAPSTESGMLSSENTTNQSSDSTVPSSSEDEDKETTVTSSSSTTDESIPSATESTSSSSDETESSNTTKPSELENKEEGNGSENSPSTTNAANIATRPSLSGPSATTSDLNYSSAENIHSNTVISSSTMEKSEPNPVLSSSSTVVTGSSIVSSSTVTSASNFGTTSTSTGQGQDTQMLAKASSATEATVVESVSDSGISVSPRRGTTSLTVKPKHLPKTGTNWSIWGLVSFLPMLVGFALFKKKS
ncbi:YSIRK-type signal peptide-containing protein [Streptococcus sp. ZJ93]|uniref:YSIRK-type signal peptide-containing protein n=1 Tax=Streptococcus handemini TaxID=3161188 RepID=UPI0032EAD635